MQIKRDDNNQTKHSFNDTSHPLSKNMSNQKQIQTIKPQKRGRKSSIDILDLTSDVVLQQHHFNYSNNFADLLANFATEHLEDKNKEFKTAWKTWTEIYSAEIDKETVKMKQDGYPGDVAEKMYFSARYYYRKKAIREQTEPLNPDEKTPRKKYESIDKQVLVQMNDQIVLQLQKNAKNMTPSKAFADYCEKYSIAEDDTKVKKTYKNLYWRISKQVSTK